MGQCFLHQAAADYMATAGGSLVCSLSTTGELEQREQPTCTPGVRDREILELPSSQRSALAEKAYDTGGWKRVSLVSEYVWTCAEAIHPVDTSGLASHCKGRCARLSGYAPLLVFTAFIVAVTAPASHSDQSDLLGVP